MAKVRTIWLGLLALLVAAPAHAATIGPAAGTGDAGYRDTDEAVAATSAWLNAPRGLAAVPGGGWLIADSANARIRAVDAGGLITTAAGVDGSGTALQKPVDVAALPGGGFVIADGGSHQILAVGADGKIRTLAGPEGLLHPAGIDVEADGSVLIADSEGNVVHRVDAQGRLTTIAGTGEPGFDGDGGAATSARLFQPVDVAVLADGTIAVADRGNDRVRHIAPDGTISTLAGGLNGFAGDSGPATAARLASPSALARAPDEALLVADEGNRRVRRISASGRITTIAGSGVEGDGGDAGPAPAAAFGTVAGLAAMADGSVLIADAATHRVRRVAANALPTVALTGPDQVAVGKDAPFTAAATGGGDDSVTAIAWDLDGDGGYETATGLDPHATVRSSTPGARTVRVQVLDEYGAEAVATRTLTVIAAPSPGGDEGGGEPPPSPRPAAAAFGDAEMRRVETTIQGAFRATARYTTVIRLVVRGVPAGARISVRCQARGCPRSWSRRYARSRESLNLRRLVKLAGRRLQPGTLEIRVTAPNRVGKVVRWTLRRGRPPLTRSLCLPAGETTPRACGTSERSGRSRRLVRLV